MRPAPKLHPLPVSSAAPSAVQIPVVTTALVCIVALALLVAVVARIERQRRVTLKSIATVRGGSWLGGRWPLAALGRSARSRVTQ